MMAEPEEQHKSTEPVDEKDYEKRKWDIRVYTQADKELSEAELAKLRDLQHSTDNHPVTPVLFEPNEQKINSESSTKTSTQAISNRDPSVRAARTTQTTSQVNNLTLSPAPFISAHDRALIAKILIIIGAVLTGLSLLLAVISLGGPPLVEGQGLARIRSES